MDEDNDNVISEEQENDSSNEQSEETSSSPGVFNNREIADSGSESDVPEAEAVPENKEARSSAHNISNGPTQEEGHPSEDNQSGQNSNTEEGYKNQEDAAEMIMRRFKEGENDIVYSTTFKGGSNRFIEDLPSRARHLL